MKKYVIYKYTSPSKRCYIGLTCDEERRKKDHMKSEHDWSITTKFAGALRKYGYEKFQYEVIDFAETWEELGPKEKSWIKFYDSVENGYNICEGGHNFVIYRLSTEKIDNIQLLLRIGEMTQKRIAETVGVSESIISTLKNGKGTRGLEQIKRKSLILKGSKVSTAKLSEEQVAEIKEKLKSGASRKSLQQEYKVSKTLIQLIATNQNWNHVESGYVYEKKQVNGNAKLTAEIVKEIKKDLRDGMFSRIVAEKYRISESTVNQIRYGKTWKSVE